MSEGAGLRVIPSNKPQRVGRIHDCIRLGYSEMTEWARKALKGRRYFAGHQWGDMLTAQQSRRIRMTHNVIRDDLEKKIARVEEADLVMETHGRGGEDWQLGQGWRDLLAWWRDWHGEFHDSAGEVHRKAWTDMHVVGDGFVWPVWDPNEEDGLGMVVLEYGCPFHTCWTPGGNSVQLRDRNTFWVARFEPCDIDLLEQEFPKLKGQIKADVPRFFADRGQMEAQFPKYQTPQGVDPGSWYTRMNQAYRMEFWEKRAKKVNRYLLDGRLASVTTPDGRRVEMTDETYDKLKSKAEKEQFEVVSIDDYELWQSVVIGDHMPMERLSDYDATKGGHGRFPLARFAASWDPDQTHSRGEVEPLLGYQDLINQSLTYYAESMFIGNSQLLWYTRGSMPQSEERKLENFGQAAVQRVRGYPGMMPPQFVSSAGQAPALFQSMAEYLTALKEKYGSSVTNVHRAAPEYDMSGKAIQELMAEADLASVKLRKGIESGLAQETYLVIALMMQNMRANRMIRITPKAGQEGYNLYVGTDKDRISQAKGLQRVPGTEDEYQTQGAKPQRARVLQINDQDVLKFDVRLTLEVNKARTKADNLKLAMALMQYTGGAGGIAMVKWLADIMEAPNKDALFEALDEADGQAKMARMVQELQDQTGVSIQDAFAAAQMVAAGPKAGAPGMPPGGNGRAQPAMAG
uniref:Portal protein n=1 Tax=viral metagenome TaxID=1070528 RepID=A0A6M3KLF1_9ZZZZ